jgi:hypothetical protein
MIVDTPINKLTLNNKEVIMHSALLVIETPEDLSHPDTERAWRELKAILSHTINTIGDRSRIRSIQLSETIFLLPLAEHMNAFASLTSATQGKGFSYQVLFFEEEPRWICSK